MPPTIVDDIVGGLFLRLDVDLAGLHAHLVGQAVIGLGAVHKIGDVILLAGKFNVDLRGKRGTALVGGLFRFGSFLRFDSGLCGLACGLCLGCGSFCSGRNDRLFH